MACHWAAVDVDVVAEYGVAIMPLVQAVRCNVVEWVQTMTGLEVVEVNVVVKDLHMPGDDEPDQSMLRVTARDSPSRR